MAHDHHHDHGVSAETQVRPLAVALALIVAFMAAEVVLAVVADSLALLSDAAHMLTDAAALGMSVWAARLALRPAAGRMTFGSGARRSSPRRRTESRCCCSGG